ncbi:MAG: nucleotidyltransferase [Betaproteobacteria bacterium HGW-Betaproteobacteria-6]|nr:MAG: nucleotidyltransferase [Betaproteobacteria bacterium HGW-Betaproteobacteria-6]
MNSDFTLSCRQQLELAADLQSLVDPKAAPALAGRLREYLLAEVKKGLDGVVATRLVSEFSDRLTARVIELTSRRHRLPPVAWCWLALGSEGRHEQTFVTDQDNGLIFNATSEQEADALRQIYLPFAQEVNQRLADCGFALCTGQIMAGNPAWCLSLEEWRERFIDWVRRPEPEALLNASIFFDLRPLYGELTLGEELRTVLLAMTEATPSFEHLMAANALQVDVPLNFRGEVAVDEGESVDLKKYGSRIFVDAARIFALSSGTRAVGTAERLRQAGAAIGLPASEIAAAEAAFSQILRLRLGQQIDAAERGEAGGHGLKPSALHDVDRAILRETLKQARRLQQRLKLNYAL